MNNQRSDIGEVMNQIAETGMSMNYRANQKPEKKYFPALLMVLMSVVIFVMLSALVARSAYADVVTLLPDGDVPDIPLTSWAPLVGPLLSDDVNAGGGGVGRRQHRHRHTKPARGNNAFVRRG